MLRTKKNDLFDIVIVGGLGHVGLPLGLVFAEKGLKVCLCDLDSKRAELIRRGQMPFIEYGAPKILKNVIRKNKLIVSMDMRVIAKARYIVIAIGTPVDEYLNPKIRSLLELFTNIKKYLRRDQAIIVRSTVYPHTCRMILKALGDSDGPWHIAYCPERIAQGYAIRELKKLPQLVSGLTEKAVKDASKLFSIISPKIIKVSIEEAELAKLYTNTWRYIQFAIANQFYIIANDFGVDFNTIRKVMVEGYERAVGLPSAGFAAGPCLLKDTMQLSAFNKNNFFLGYSAMMINEGLPNYIVEDIRRRKDMSKTKVGILGMAFKADIDDIRDSLSYKLRKILQFHGIRVLCSDEYVKDHTFVSKEKILKSCDIVIIGVPHSAYKNLKIPKKLEVVDLWGITTKDVKQ
jgi:UDP-N-acetyl-D-mannosaminuronic acid dehydrogenase